MAARTGQAIMENLGKGDWVGALVAGAAGVVSVISKLWGGGGEKKKVDEQRQALIDLSGGWQGINEKAHKAGVTLDKVLNARTVKEYEAAVRELEDSYEAVNDAIEQVNAAIEHYGLSLKDLADPIAQQAAFDDQLGDLIDTFHDLEDAGYASDAILKAMGEDFVATLQGAADAGLLEGFIDDLVEAGRLTRGVGDHLLALVAKAGPNFQELTKLADDYGIKLADLGPTFQQAHVSETAEQIAKDFNALIKAGADVNGVMVGMKDEVQKLLDESVKFGTAIPNNMRPMLETMAANGLLLDKNGQKMKDLAGLTFADSPLEQGIDQLTLAIQDLVAALTDVPDKINKIGATPIAADQVPGRRRVQRSRLCLPSAGRAGLCERHRRPVSQLRIGHAGDAARPGEDHAGRRGGGRRRLRAARRGAGAARRPRAAAAPAAQTTPRRAAAGELIMDAYSNLAVSSVAAAPSPATSGTTLSVSAGHGARFPTVPFNATVWPAGVLPDPTTAEIVRVTARSTDALTITRAQESTRRGRSPSAT